MAHGGTQTSPRGLRAQRSFIAFFALTLSAGCSHSHGATAAADAGRGRSDTGRSTPLGPGPGPTTRPADASVVDASMATFDGAIPDASMSIPPDEVCRAAPVAPECDRLCPIDAAPFYVWNGYRCAEVGPCDIDPAMAVRYDDLGACVTATRSCEAMLCIQTFGRWLPEPEYCGHHPISGLPAPRNCESPGPACNCGFGRTFDPARGCYQPDESPELIDVATQCHATGGYCPNAQPCAAETCDCLAGRRFESAFGCVPDWTLVGDGCEGCPPEVIQPKVEGEVCDLRASSCGDGLTCCPSLEPWVPRCADPCDCSVDDELPPPSDAS